MVMKPDGKVWTVTEQIVDDPVSGLQYQFEVMPDGSPRLRVFGESLPFGNRELVFSDKGVFDGGGTSTSGLCKPAWMVNLDD